MDTKLFCVYNLARGVYLNSKVTIADCANEPLKILRVVVSGIALNAESGVWLTPLTGRLAVPRLFPFDLLYLDKEEQVLEAVEIFPGAEFPLYRPEVASALLLPQRVIQATQTAKGDRLIICLEEELGRVLSSLKAAAPAGRVSSADALKTIVAGQHAVKGEAQGSRTGASANGHAKTESVQQAGPRLLHPRADLAGGSTPLPALAEKARFSAGAPRPEPKESKEAKTTSGQQANASQAPEIAITEVVIEKPPGVPAKSPVHPDPEDLFANWVDSSSVAPAWITGVAEAERSSAAVVARASEAASRAGTRPVSETPADTNRLGQVRPTPGVVAGAVPQKPLDAKTEPKPVANPRPERAAPAQPVNAAPSRVAVPSPQTTFTISQYGIWHVSTPTAIHPAVSKGSVDRSASQPAPAEKSPQPQTHPGTTSEPDDPAPKRASSESFSAAHAQTSPKAPSGGGRVGTPILRNLPAPDSKGSPGSPLGTFSSARDEGALARGSAVPRPSEPTKRAAIAPTANTAVQRLSQISREEAKASSLTRELQVRQEAASSSDRAGTPASRTRPGPGEPGNGTVGVESKPPASTQSAAERIPKKERPREEVSVIVPLPRVQKPMERVEKNEKKQVEPRSLREKFRHWLNPVSPPSDRRKALRRYVPGVVAHYYTGGAPKPHEVADISMTGLYLLTEDRWIPETMIQMTLQRPCAKGERKQSITVLLRVVRRGSDGIAAEFVMPESLDPRSHDVQPSQTTDRFALARFL